MKLLIVCSSGGHLAQMWALKPFWVQHDRVWVTLPTGDAVARLAHEETVWAHYPTVRNVPNLLRNAVLARRVLRQVRPDMIVSTGAAVAVPFFAQARALGAVTVHLEPVDRVRRPSLSGRLLYPYADHFFVQWPEIADRLPSSEHVGVVL